MGSMTLTTSNATIEEKEITPRVEIDFQAISLSTTFQIDKTERKVNKIKETINTPTTILLKDCIFMTINYLIGV